MRKPDCCLCGNKDADQLCNCTADQRLCFRYIGSTISPSSFFSETVLAGLCRTWSETTKTGFHVSRFDYVKA